MSPRLAASWRLSGFVMYFCNWNRFSRPFRCRLLNTARVHDFFRFPAPVRCEWRLLSGWPGWNPGKKCECGGGRPGNSGWCGGR